MPTSTPSPTPLEEPDDLRLEQQIARRARVARKLSQYAPVLRTLLLLGALLLLVLLPIAKEPFSRAVYVDENALQPGQTSTSWSMDDVHEADRFSADLLALAERNVTERYEYIAAQLRAFGLDVYTQSYSFHVPGSAPIQGTNIYARARTPRIDGREAIVLGASWQSRWRASPTASKVLPYVPNDGTDCALNIRGVSLTLAMAQHVSRIPYWSKDVVFVLSDSYLDGMQAWASAWFGQMHPHLHAEPVYGAGSQIWNALMLDYPGDSYSSISYLHEGRDGQLPNLDTLNAITEILRLSHMQPALGLHGSTHEQVLQTPHASAFPSWLPMSWLETTLLGRDGVHWYLAGWRALLTQFRLLLAGHPSGIHGVLLPFHVDAVTLFAEPASGPYGFQHLGHVTESALRTFSNLLERLHHSQFFYLLPTPYRFVPIGVFLFVPLLLAAVLTLRGLSLWNALGRARDAQRTAWRTQHTPADDAGALSLLAQPTYAEFAALCQDENARAQFLSYNRPVLSALLAMVLMVATGLAGLAVLVSMTPTPRAFTQLIVTLTLVPLVCVQMCPRSWAKSLAQCIHAFALLHAGMLISVLATLNFAQATAMALCLSLTLYPLSPPTCSSRVGYRLMTLWLTIATPLSLWVIALAVPSTSAMAQALLLHAVRDWYVVRTSTLSVLFVGYMPLAWQSVLAAGLYARAA